MNEIKIKNIAVEIEGGWKQNMYHQRFDHWHVGGDGTIPGYFNNRAELKVKHNGFAFEDLDGLFKDELKKVMKYLKQVNERCGIHCHISFSKGERILYSDNFPEYFYYGMLKLISRKIDITNSESVKARWRKLKELYKSRKDVKWSRLRSRKDIQKSIEQRLLATSYRYSTVNYRSLYKHGTIEFRIFPAVMKYQDIMFFIKGTIKVIEKYAEGRGEIDSDMINDSKNIYFKTGQEIREITSREF